MDTKDPLIEAAQRILEAQTRDTDDIKTEIREAVYDIVQEADLTRRCQAAVTKVLRQHPELSSADQRELTNWSWLVIRDFGGGGGGMRG